MSTPIETTTVTTVNEVPSKNETPAIINVEDHPVNVETGTTSVITNAPSAVKVTPTQRLNSLFVKAKQTVTDTVSETQKALSERKTHTGTTATTEVPPTTDVANVTSLDTGVTPDVADRKEAGLNHTFKDLLTRVKGLRSTSTQPAVVESTEQIVALDNEAPVPPPKDDIKPASNPNSNPVLEQFKRNTALLTSYILQKKKEFTEKKSSDEHHQTTTPELHGETVSNTATTNNTTAEKPASAGSPFVRRITQLVNNATASINKKREPKKKEETTTIVSEPTITISESPAVVTSST